MRISRRKKALLIAGSVALAATTLLAGCTSDANRVSQNLSTSADQFKVYRQVVVQNDITDKYIIEVTGLCSVSPSSKQLAIICQTGPDSYKKDIAGLANNVSWSVVQLQGQSVSKYHYEIVFKPENVVPGFDLETGGK